MYIVWDVQSDLSLVRDGAGLGDLCHVHNGAHSVTNVFCGGWRGEEDFSHERSGGRPVTNVPNGGWGRKVGSMTCTQWGMLTDT